MRQVFLFCMEKLQNVMNVFLYTIPLSLNFGVSVVLRLSQNGNLHEDDAVLLFYIYKFKKFQKIQKTRMEEIFTRFSVIFCNFLLIYSTNCVKLN